MSKIDVSKCRRYMSIDGCCLASYEENELGGSWEFCKDNPDCYYKQLQQLKAENKEIRKINDTNAKLMIKLRDCLDEIEKIAKDFHSSMIILHKGNRYAISDIFNSYLDKIKQLIKQAKEGE